jgi:hypothetical protein
MTFLNPVFVQYDEKLVIALLDGFGKQLLFLDILQYCSLDYMPLD